MFYSIIVFNNKIYVWQKAPEELNPTSRLVWEG